MSRTTIEVRHEVPAEPPGIPTAATWYGTIVPGTNTSSNAVGHVSNTEYVRWLDQVGQRHLASLGWSGEDLLGTGAMWFVARHEIDYRREAHAGETLLVATWVRDVRRVKSWRDTIVWRVGPEQAETVCTASTLWVHVDLNTRRPVRPPADMVAALLRGGEPGDPPWRERR
jgi:acyl-CoA thioester hydrolase